VLKPRSAASTDEAALHAARDGRSSRNCRLHSREQSCGIAARARVRKFVTPKYAYLVYYTVDETVDEIVILNVKHPARRREHGDA
jgi:hypothetical protein